MLICFIVGSILLVFVIPIKWRETSNDIAVLNLSDHNGILDTFTKLMKFLHVKVVVTGFENSSEHVRSNVEIQESFKIGNIFDDIALNYFVITVVVISVSEALISLMLVLVLLSYQSGSIYFFPSSISNFTFFLWSGPTSFSWLERKCKLVFLRRGAGVKQISETSAYPVYFLIATEFDRFL